MRPAAVLTLLCACADDPWAEPLPDAPPPPALSLDASWPVPGQWAGVAVRVGAPNVTVHVAVSTVGPGAGPCPRVLGGRCLGIVRPTLLGTVVSDATGVARLNYEVPAAWSGGEVWFQAAKGTPNAAVTEIDHWEVAGAGDIFLPNGPTKRQGHILEFGYYSVDPVDLWWDNTSQLCMTAFPFGNTASLDATDWTGISGLPFTYGCWNVAAGDAFALPTLFPLEYAVVRVGDDYDPTPDGPGTNTIHLDSEFPATEDRWEALMLPSDAGARGWIAGTGYSNDVNQRDIWWDGTNICVRGESFGVREIDGDVPLYALAWMTSTADLCTPITEIGQSFGAFTLSGGTVAIRVLNWHPGAWDVALRISPVQ